MLKTCSKIKWLCELLLGYKHKTTRTFEHRWEAWRVLVVQRYVNILEPPNFFRFFYNLLVPGSSLKMIRKHKLYNIILYGNQKVLNFTYYFSWILKKSCHLGFSKSFLVCIIGVWQQEKRILKRCSNSITGRCIGWPPYFCTMMLRART